MRIGIFGGSFNPIHRGHVALATWIVSQKVVDEVWLMVSPQNPLKVAADLMPEHRRMELAELALKDVEGIRACDFEWKLPRPSYTWHTLCALRKAYPENEFSLIIGGDNWKNFHKWAFTDEILSTTNIWVYPRPDSELTEECLPTNVKLLSGAPLFPYSSTEVRAALASGCGPNDMLPEAVAKALQCVDL